MGIYFLFSPHKPRDRIPGPPSPSVLEPLSETDSARIKIPKTQIPPPSPPVKDEAPSFDDEDAATTALVGDRTLRVIDGILERIRRDLESGFYGDPGLQAYNMIFQFHQSLSAFRRLLENPLEGPDFRFSLKKEILGRYTTREQKILLGPDTIESEGVFLVVLFHEYQHHLLHTIMGSPRRDDLVGLFYNELAAHLFEDLFAAYLPASYFEKPYRGSLPVQLKRLLSQGQSEKAMLLLLRLLSKIRTEDDSLFYEFLAPVESGAVDAQDVVDAISQDFVPDEEKSEIIRRRLK